MAQAGGAPSADADAVAHFDRLPPLVIAALASRLPGADLVRLSLAAKSGRAALEAVPRLYETACAHALGWPASQSPPAPARASSGGGGVQQQDPPQPPQPAGPAAAGAVAPDACGAGEGYCRDLLSAACALAAAAAPHCLKPQAQAPAPNVAPAIGKAPGFVRVNPRELSPPLALTERQQCLLTIGAPGVHSTSCSVCPRSRAGCRAAVAIEVGGRVAAELYLSAHHQGARHPPPGWHALLASAPADARAAVRNRGGIEQGGGGEDRGGGEDEDADAGEGEFGAACERWGPPAAFELYLSEAVDVFDCGGDGGGDGSSGGGDSRSGRGGDRGGRGRGRGAPNGGGRPAAGARAPGWSCAWRDVRDAILGAVSRAAARAGTARRAAVLHPCSTGSALLAAERAVARLASLGYPVLDLRAVLDHPPGSRERLAARRASDDGGAPAGPAGPAPVGAAASGARGGALDDGRRRWRLACAMVREEALAGADGLGGMGGFGMPHMQAVSQALTRAVQAMPNVARAARVVVIPIVLPPGGRVGRMQPGRAAHRAVAAPHLLSLMAPVLGPLRLAAAQLPHLQQVLLVCPLPEERGSASTFTYGVTQALALSCLDRS